MNTQADIKATAEDGPRSGFQAGSPNSREWILPERRTNDSPWCLSAPGARIGEQSRRTLVVSKAWLSPQARCMMDSPVIEELSSSGNGYTRFKMSLGYEQLNLMSSDLRNGINL